MDDLAAFLDAINCGDLKLVTNMLEADSGLSRRRDANGATPLHYATLSGQRQIAVLLIEKGADVNAVDDRFGATPAGWAIEYLRERGGFLAIELVDFSNAIETCDIEGVDRFLKRFPALADARDQDGVPFRERASASGCADIFQRFEAGGTR